MDNPTRWNITNSAQNIVSALVDPSKQFDSVFRREWSNTFSSFTRPRPVSTSQIDRQDAKLKAKLSEYINRIEDREQIKSFEALRKAQENENEKLQVSRKPIQIPSIFLREDFNLAKDEIFNQVISSIKGKSTNKESSRVNQSDEDDDVDLDQLYRNGKNSLTKDELKELQSNFTDYLDIIEEKLASQVSNRSGDFFQVMSSVDSVMDELSLAIKSVTNLRKKCSSLNNALIMPNMKNIRLTKARDNAQLVLDKMRQIEDLCKVQPMIQLLLSTSDYDGALNLIAKARVTLQKDLTRVVSLKHLESQLVEIEKAIGAMMQQEFLEAEKFVNEFHEERKKRIESNLDIEQWKMVDDVPEEFQLLFSRLIDEDISISEAIAMEEQDESNDIPKTHTRTPSNVSATSLNINEKQSNQRKSNGTLSQIMKSSSSDKLNSNIKLHSTDSRRSSLKINYVTAGGSTYVIVNSVIHMVQTIIEYCKCASELRSLSDKLLERLFKILQLYNSKTYHLVYSAGAIQVAGLKTITTRNLIVAQRSLKLIILLIPALQKHFAQLLPPDNRRLERFDDIRRFYEDHAAEIPERVNSIVRDVINLQLIDWGAKPPVPSQQFTAVAQHLMRLHDNIQDALPPGELRLLFLKINDTFKNVLIMHLRRLNINNDAGPQQWLVTQELTFYKISLSKLSIFKGLELNYDDLWYKLNEEEDSDSNEDRKQKQQQREEQQIFQQKHQQNQLGS